MGSKVWTESSAQCAVCTNEATDMRRGGTTIPTRPRTVHWTMHWAMHWTMHWTMHWAML